MNLRFTTLSIAQPKEHVTLVTLNRPAVANAMNTQLGTEIMTLFEALNLDDGATRCVVVTGTGDRAFCAGADLKDRKDMTDEAWVRQHLIYERMVRAILACPIPIIAAVNGAAYGGGCELALACDFIYASEHAKFALTEVTLGIMPGAGGTQNLPRAIGERRAKEVILTGKPFTAAEGHQWGLVPSENSIRLDSQHELESSHHPRRCLRSCTCSGSSLSTFSSRDAGWKPRTCFFIISLTSHCGERRLGCGCTAVIGRSWYG